MSIYSTAPASPTFAERHPFLVEVAKEAGKSFLVSAAISFGVMFGCRVATLGMNRNAGSNAGSNSEGNASE